jgi:hypothetical protein
MEQSVGESGPVHRSSFLQPAPISGDLSPIGNQAFPTALDNKAKHMPIRQWR